MGFRECYKCNIHDNQQRAINDDPSLVPEAQKSLAKHVLELDWLICLQVVRRSTILTLCLCWTDLEV